MNSLRMQSLPNFICTIFKLMFPLPVNHKLFNSDLYIYFVTINKQQRPTGNNVCVAPRVLCWAWKERETWQPIRARVLLTWFHREKYISFQRALHILYTALEKIMYAYKALFKGFVTFIEPIKTVQKQLQCYNKTKA